MAQLTSRLIVSLMANLGRSVLTFVTSMLLARTLGPLDYGRLAFLIGAFTALRGLIDLGSSTAFFTLLSRRPRSRTFIGIFWGFVAIQLLVAGAVLLVLPDALMESMWAREPRSLLMFAFLATFMQGTVWTLAVQMAEASRRTVRAQAVQTVVVVVHLLVVASLALLNRMAISLVLVALIIEWTLAALIVARLYKPAASAADSSQDGVDTPSSVFREIATFCAPLIPSMLLGVAHDFADRWMLQTWSGPREQAFFSVAQQYSAIALLATTSVLRILWKEIAEAHDRKSTDRVRMLYERACRTLFFVSAFLCGGLQPLAPDLLRWSVGTAYADGATAMAVMLMIPLHQSIGQICGTMLLATGHTRTYALCSSAGMVISLLAAYVVLAPTTAALPGLHLGADGLAWKVVLVQMVSVNLMTWAIARQFGWRYDVMYQLLIMAVCLASGWAAHVAAGLLIHENAPPVVRAMTSGALYVWGVIALVVWQPGLLATTREELRVQFGRLRRRSA